MTLSLMGAPFLKMMRLMLETFGSPFLMIACIFLTNHVLLLTILILNPPSWDDYQSCPISPMVDDLDYFNIPYTSNHYENFQPSNPPIFDDYPCEDSTSLYTSEDEICTRDSHDFQDHTHPFPSPSSFDPMHDVEKPPSFSPLSNYHNIISSFDFVCDDDPYVNPVHLWIEACCDNDLSYLKNMKKCLCSNNLMF